MKLAIITARTKNALIRWSVVEVPGDPGPTWYQLGQIKRNPFHLYFSQQEAQELQDMVMGLEKASGVVEKYGLEMEVESGTGKCL